MRYDSSYPSDMVVWPTSTEQVSKVSKLCYDLNVPVTPFGTGTGLEGGVNALKGGVCIALTKMDKVVEVNAEDFDCTVEAGVTWRDMNQYLNGTGLFFPVGKPGLLSLSSIQSFKHSPGIYTCQQTRAHLPVLVAWLRQTLQEQMRSTTAL